MQHESGSQVIFWIMRAWTDVTTGHVRYSGKVFVSYVRLRSNRDIKGLRSFSCKSF